MGHGLYNGSICANDVLEQFCPIAGNTDPLNILSPGRLELGEEGFGVFNGIPLAESVAGEDNFLLRRETDGFGSCRAKIAANDHFAKIGPG